MQLTSNFVALALAMGAIGASAMPSKVSNEPIEIPMKRGPRGNLLDSNGLVSYEKIAKEVNHVRQKYARTMKNYKAHAGSKHELDATHLLTPAQRRGTGSVSLTDTENEQLWVGNIGFGTPVQQIPIDFDTGSSDTLVNPGAYTPSKSSTSHDTNTRFQDSYGDGTTAEGEVYSDKLSIGGGLTADKAYIGLSQSQFIKGEGQSQGISGMAFPSLATFQQKEPWVYSLIKANALDKQAFQFKLRKSGSTLTIGSSSDSAQWTPVTQAAYWSVSGSISHGGSSSGSSGQRRRQFGSGSDGSYGWGSSGDGSYGGGSSGDGSYGGGSSGDGSYGWGSSGDGSYGSGSGGEGSFGSGSGGEGSQGGAGSGNGSQVNGIIDSGTTLIIAPTSDAQSLFQSMGLQTTNQQGQLMATFPCSQPPQVSFTFGSKSISLGDSTSFGQGQDGSCVFSVVGADVGSAGWIVGDPLFRQTTVSFDVGGKRVGFD